MPTFIATAKSPSGETRTLSRVGDSRTAVLIALRAEGLIPMRIDEAREKRKFDFRSLIKPSGSGVALGRREMQTFLNSFGILLRSGMDLERCLRTLQKESSEPLRGILVALAERVRQGEALSVAMTRAGIFSPFQVNVVRAGEYSGNLHEAMQRLSTAIEREVELRSKIRNAIAYPIFLIFFGLASLTVMMVFVLPKFMTIYTEMNIRLPFMTSLLLRSSTLLKTHGIWVFPLVAIATYTGIRKLLRFRDNMTADRLRLRLPLMGRIFQEIEISRFLRTLGLLIQSGIPVAQALEICIKVVGSAVFIKATMAIEKGIQVGSKLSSEMREQGLFGESILNLVSVGEESGQLPTVLIETADNIDKRLDEMIRGLLTLLEPLLILIVGTIIGLIVMSMLLPIFSLSSGLRR